MTRSRELAELATAYDTGGLSSFKNRIINGAMMIDQRNAGAAVTTSGYNLDRFIIAVGAGTENATFSVQKDTVVPSNSGFINSLKFLITSAETSIAATERIDLQQRIEGFNVADLMWGSTNAAPVTLSFWVRSSLTGTFGGALMNGGQDRSYPFAYTISSANTWEYKTLTISGDTAGTWLTNNGIGLRVIWSLGAGSSMVGTAGSWASGSLFGATGQTQVISTNGATFYITGVQLEKGSTATSFDYRPYSTELALCQRYYQNLTRGIFGYWGSTTNCSMQVVFPVQMRSTPSSTVLFSGMNIGDGTAGRTGTASIVSSSGASSGLTIDLTGFSGATQWRPAYSNDNNTNLIGLSAEL